MKRSIWKKNQTSTKRKTEKYNSVLSTQIIFYVYLQGDKQVKKYFNLSWMIVIISYHKCDNLAELLNRDLATKIGRGIFSKYLMDRK